MRTILSLILLIALNQALAQQKEVRMQPVLLQTTNIPATKSTVPIDSSKLVSVPLKDSLRQNVDDVTGSSNLLSTNGSIVQSDRRAKNTSVQNSGVDLLSERRDSMVANSNLNRKAEPQPRTELNEKKITMPPNYEFMQFSNGTDKFIGQLHKPLIPKKAKYPVLFVIHSFGESADDLSLYPYLVEDMNKIGYSVFFYDQVDSSYSTSSGWSGSSKNVKNAGIQTLAADAVVALNYLKSRINVDTSKIALFGIGQGGYVAALLNSIRTDIDFNILLSTSTMSTKDQMDYGVFAKLNSMQFSPKQIDSAIRVRSVVDDYYHSRITYDQAITFIHRDTASSWYKYAFIPEVLQEKSKSTWYAKMDLDPMLYFRYLNKPSLAIYGEQDQLLYVDKSIADLRQLNLPALEIKKVNLAGHLMVEFENSNPVVRTVSGMYRNLIEHWVKKQWQ